MRDTEFLNYKQSTIAAASFILAMNTTFTEDEPYLFESVQDTMHNDEMNEYIG